MDAVKSPTIWFDVGLENAYKLTNEIDDEPSIARALTNSIWIRPAYTIRLKKSVPERYMSPRVWIRISKIEYCRKVTGIISARLFKQKRGWDKLNNER